MDYIGSVPPKIFALVLDIARKESYPIDQPQDCPYILLVRVNDKQLLALSGLFSKQHIDLMIIEISRPDTTEKDRISIDQKDWNKAHAYAQELLAKALIQNSHTSSTTSQPPKDRE